MILFGIFKIITTYLSDNQYFTLHLLLATSTLFILVAFVWNKNEII